MAFAGRLCSWTEGEQLPSPAGPVIDANSFGHASPAIKTVWETLIAHWRTAIGFLMVPADVDEVDVVALRRDTMALKSCRLDTTRTDFGKPPC